MGERDRKKHRWVIKESEVGDGERERERQRDRETETKGKQGDG